MSFIEMTLIFYYNIMKTKAQEEIIAEYDEWPGVLADVPNKEYIHIKKYSNWEVKVETIYINKYHIWK